MAVKKIEHNPRTCHEYLCEKCLLLGKENRSASHTYKGRAVFLIDCSRCEAKVERTHSNQPAVCYDCKSKRKKETYKRKLLLRQRVTV